MSQKRNRGPMPGWNLNIPLANARPPAVPATLNITLEEYYAAAGAIGLLAAQIQEPEADWALNWSLDFGERMAAEARRRRLKAVKK